MELSDFGLIEHTTSSISVGEKFGRLTIMRIGKRPNSYDYRVIYKCDCGVVGEAPIQGVKSGQWKSCGCWNKDRVKKHGLWGTKIITVWRHMMSRCHDPSHERYADYGGRGIFVCERWHDPSLFAADMQSEYQSGMYLDRRNNDGPYCKDNCRWISMKEQQRNKRNNINVTINGRTQVLKDWCTELGLNYQSVYYRIKERGMEPELALTTPLLKGRRLPN